MSESRAGQHTRTIDAGPSLSAHVLADRMAAALLHHEPGWRLPRHTALARRYNVTPAEVDAAIGLLVQRHLLSRLPDGQVFRASPAEYRLTLEGLPGLLTHVDPMGGELVCKSRNVARRRAAEDIARVLGTPPGKELLTVRCLWTVGGEPAAYSAGYLPPEMEGLASELAAAAAPAGLGTRHSRPRAFQIDFQAPAPSVARTLRLSAGEPAAAVTVRFEDSTQPGVSALTVTVLRAELFRIVVESPDSPALALSQDGPPGGWTHAVEGCQP
ncbi:MAG TPA: UTRA domain-containing protein [Streptosporangiaceae bacterium]|nr:UTRA domain-containing protein [Streptosporangiaceae bacterium]